MIKPSILAATVKTAPGLSPDRLFSGLLECSRCSARQTADILWVAYRALHREGRVRLACRSCGQATAHRLVRITG